jgi:hypothetical protein
MTPERYCYSFVQTCAYFQNSWSHWLVSCVLQLYQTCLVPNFVAFLNVCTLFFTQSPARYFLTRVHFFVFLFFFFFNFSFSSCFRPVLYLDYYFHFLLLSLLSGFFFIFLLLQKIPFTLAYSILLFACSRLTEFVSFETFLFFLSQFYLNPTPF